MKFQTSPYLPGWEYMPDGEPHIFGDRLYVFGSHDRFDGVEFCENDYVCWSAPLCDLADWRCDGIIYKKTQDPANTDGKLPMWAPDVCLGADGRFYLYYCLAGYPRISVAVSDTPSGKYEFYGYVRDKNGNFIGARPEDNLPFDPGVFVDCDGKIHLYSGSAPAVAEGFETVDGKPQSTAFHMELERDMLTLKTPMHAIVPNIFTSKGTGFEGHEFFEASSMRRFGDKYYFIYSSVRFHELCFAVSNSPDGEFTYGGTLVSNGDVLPECDIRVVSCPAHSRDIKNYIGNTHGSVEYIDGEYFVFYHRHTNRHQLSRQGCVARIKMSENGMFEQAEMTSCGFAEHLPTKENIEARIACLLYSKNGGTVSDPNAQNKNEHPGFTQDTPDGECGVQYISNMCDGSCAVYKYFEFNGEKNMHLTYRGEAGGQILILCNGKNCGDKFLEGSKEWTRTDIALHLPCGKTDLTFTYVGKGYVELLDFKIE